HNNLYRATYLFAPLPSPSPSPPDLLVSSCDSSTIYILNNVANATISGCRDCTVVVGAIRGLARIVDCERCELIFAANRIVMTNSLETSVYCYTPTNPLWIGDNRSCKFAPFNVSYPGLPAQLVEAKLAVPNPNNPAVLSYHPNKYNLATDVEKSSTMNPPPPSPSTGEIAFSAPTTVSPADFNFYSLPVPFAAEQDTQAADTQLASPHPHPH
ncbi:hypothetical protein TrRE_jg3153, partial [Triparma retinervis]